MEKGDKVQLTIEDVSTEGQGIGKADGFAVFVRDTVVGDSVLAELTKVKKNYAFGRVDEYLKLSEARREALCPYDGSCGGCVYQHTEYASQLILKRKQVRDKLVRLGGIQEPDVKETIGMEEPFRYRNKVSMPVSTGGLITKKGGVTEPVHEPRIGFYRAKSHDVTNCEDCLLQSLPAMAAAEALRRFMREDNITSYDQRWDKGLMRHMVVRTAVGTGEVMVILVINGKGIPNAAKLVEMLDEAIFELPPQAGPWGEEVQFSLESVIININKKGREILGSECITLAGKPTITEKVGSLEFEISPLSFYQVNPVQMEKLYKKALEYAELKGGETVLDLYCGVGTIGLFFADHMRKTGGSGRVIGIESVREAVVDANRNAVINGIVNARYVCGPAEEKLPELMDSGADEGVRIDGADVVILDPPRAGCDERLLEAVGQLAPDKIVYISCDPATLSRDIKYLTSSGYEFCEATPVDMFPWTGAIEVVAKLVKSLISVKIDK